MEYTHDEYIKKVRERKELIEESFKLKEQIDNSKILLLFPPLWFYSIPRYVNRSRKYKKKRDIVHTLGLEIVSYKQMRNLDKLTDTLSRRTKEERVTLTPTDDFLSEMEKSEINTLPNVFSLSS